MNKWTLFFLLFVLVGHSASAEQPHYIRTKEAAVRVGEAFLVSIYGEKVLKERPFIVSSGSSTWILMGTLHCPNSEKNCFGGTAHIEFNKSDGKIIFVTHEK